MQGAEHVKRHNWRGILQTTIVMFILTAVSFTWYAGQQRSTVQLAVAKGQTMMQMMDLAPVALDVAGLQAAALSALPQPDGQRLEFINALPLSLGEARPWRDAGCDHLTCAHVVYYNHDTQGTANAIVHLESNEQIAVWEDHVLRPPGSSFILQRAMEIAAQDARVTAVLGDIGAADPAMIPMSAWLADDACAQEWCVDLSFLDPAGSGRVFHVFVNMTRNEVARTFYTRARAALDVPAPVAQRDAYDDGCHEQDGWSVCWEMTAHDGVHFRDASYNGTAVFRSVKIPQVEAWYPSWPGGYRDEIGFAATVPPFGDTQVNDLDDGFEVRQMFTEFTRWPNCICCYRYEQVLRFFAGGALDVLFVSHGPGCDDLSEYRPFWRIDLDINDGENNTVQVWQESRWQPVTEELELFPFVDDLSPDGQKAVVSGGDTHYYLRMARTDPLGLDEARFFVLQYNEGEGDGPLLTGPGDTYQPPRQWMDGETAVETNVVLWYVPLLKTKKGDPWWCMPDPEPGVNQCDAILHLTPGEAPHEPTAEELAQMATPTSTPTPAPTSTPAPTPTPRPIEGETAEEVILNSGCAACHAMGALGEAGKVGPDLSNIGAVAAERVPGLSAEEYLRQSILEPNAYIVPDCPNGPCLAGIMPQNYGTRLTPAQIDLMIAYLVDQVAAETAVIGADEMDEESFAGATPLPKAVPAKQIAPPAYALSSSGLAVQLMLLTMVFLLTLFLVWKRPLER